MSKDMYDMLFDRIPHKNKYILEPKEIADYIINLEEDVRTGQEINSELQQENDSLKKTIKRLRKKQTQKKNKYKSCCEKAIEYIENPRHEMSVLTYQNLLNILQNGSDDNVSDRD